MTEPSSILAAFRWLPITDGEVELALVPGRADLLSLSVYVRTFPAPVQVFLQRPHLAGLLQVCADVLNAPQHAPRIWWPSGE